MLIVASGGLEYLPFAALPIPETEGQIDEGTGRQGDRGISFLPVAPSPRRPVALIAEHEIVNLPSASVLSVIRREPAGRAAAPKTVAVLADPVFETNDPRLLMAAKRRAGNQDSAFNTRSAAEA